MLRVACNRGSYEILQQKALLSPYFMTLIFHTNCNDLCIRTIMYEVYIRVLCINLFTNCFLMQTESTLKVWGLSVPSARKEYIYNLQLYYT